MLRRDFLRYTAATGGLSLLRLGNDAWAAQGGDVAQQRLVVVFLRGAADGLNVVIPYSEQDYYSLRPTIALARPGQNGGALDLDGRFGLHPALQSLLPAWKERSLAFVHACGSPDESRSHFEAQGYMESGTPGVRITRDGWMNRVLVGLPGPHAPTEAVNFGETMPKILSGKMAVASLSSGEGAEMGSALAEGTPIDSTFDRMYAGSDALSVAYRQGRVARRELTSDLQKDMMEAAGGAPSAKGFPETAAKLCHLMKNDPTIRLAFFGLSGWDTHVQQGSTEGRLARYLKPLGDGLATLHGGLGAGYGRTVVVVISEFGRTAHENGNGGTDHGHGNVMWVMGGSVNGGKVYGEWPGLDEESLHEQRDLAITTDFRSAIGEVLATHLKLTPQEVANVFPNAPPGGHSLGIMRA